jgi:hypothetical protein
MKTFAEFMEQVEVMNRAKLKLAKVKGNISAERVRRRRLYQQGLHTTMHLNQTAEKEENAKRDAYKG